MIACSNDHKEQIEEQVISDLPEVLRKRTVCVAGGKTRHRSICAALRQLDSLEPDLVIIHDAVRPLLDEKLLIDLIEAASEHGASGPVCKLTSTVLKVSPDSFLEESLERSRFRASEMPQVFQFKAIRQAYERCSDFDFEHGTECLDLVLKYGGAKVKLLEGDPNKLWKVTFKKDLITASNCIANHDTSLATLSVDGQEGGKVDHELVELVDYALRCHFDRVELSKSSQANCGKVLQIIFMESFTNLVDLSDLLIATSLLILSLNEQIDREQKCDISRQINTCEYSKKSLIIVISRSSLREPAKKEKLTNWITLIFGSSPAFLDLRGQVLFL